MEKLKVILHLSHKHPFEGRDQLSLRYMDMIEAIYEEDWRLVIGEVGLIDIPYLKRLTSMSTSLSYGEISVGRNIKEWIKWRTDTELTLYKRINKIILIREVFKNLNPFWRY